MRSKVDIVAFYLPQFHPIPQNDAWWGPGFTEWTNTAAARPLYAGHAQPNLPGELGFYDLRYEGTRLDQARLASQHGVSAFAYWHYWFNGELLLQAPLEQVLESRSPDFPFCIAWANHSWSTGTWNAVETSASTALIQQTYPGSDDHRRHFEYLLPFLSDPRYLRVDGRPLIYIREPGHIPDLEAFLDLWRGLAEASGLGDLFVTGEVWDHGVPVRGLDKVARFHRPTTLPVRRSALEAFGRRFRGRPILRDWADLAGRALQLAEHEWPVLLGNWDTTPRRGRSGTVLQGTSPGAFRALLTSALRRAASRDGHEIVFLKSWNEWAEGNYLEPDRRTGRAWLEAVRDARADVGC